MANKSVVRNQAYTRSSVGIRERHNERKNECYSNADIRLERSPFNVHFRKCEGTYTEALDKLIAEGVISTRGLKPDAKIVDEMVFDVNTSYFEEYGGYDFAKRFYEEAYKLAVKEAGDEQYVLSAVMHADEVNKAVSAELKKDVYHYHLHVIYVPIVEKEVKWTKRCKDPELVGTVKEVINQVSHSKKWPKYKDGKGEWINSYSLLQDKFFEHMKEAGFNDFERGDRRSTREHLSDMEYKIQKDMERSEKLGQNIAELDKRLSIREGGAADLRVLDNINKKNMLGHIILTPGELGIVKTLAEEGALARGKIYDLEARLKSTKREADYAFSQRDAWKLRYEDLMERTKLFREAAALIPQKVTELLARGIQEHKAAQQAQKALRRERGKGYER